MYHPENLLCLITCPPPLPPATNPPTLFSLSGWALLRSVSLAHWSWTVLFQQLPGPHQVLSAPERLREEVFNFSDHKNCLLAFHIRQPRWPGAWPVQGVRKSSARKTCSPSGWKSPDAQGPREPPTVAEIFLDQSRMLWSKWRLEPQNLPSSWLCAIWQFKPLILSSSESWQEKPGLTGVS